MTSTTRFLIFFLLLTKLATNAIAQKDTIPIDRLGTIVSRDSAKYLRVYTKIDSSLYKIEDYFTFGKLQMTGFCSNPLSAVKIGKYVFYDSTGHVNDEGEYMKGYRTGTWHRYFRNSNKLFSVKEYRYPELGCSVKYYDSLTNRISEVGFLNVDERPHGTYLEYFFNSDSVRIRRQYNNGKKNGVQLEYYKTGVVKRHEEFENNKLKLGLQFNEDGKKIKYFPAFEYPMPNESIYTRLIKHVPCYKEDKAKYKLRIRLTVHTDGSLSNIELIDYPNQACVQAIKDEIMKMKKWTPAQRENGPIIYTTEYWLQ